MKVAVFGASGLVGSTLIEETMGDGSKTLDNGMDIIPIIHSSGSAWRLARYNIELINADLLSLSSIRSAMAGATHVVNCTRGNEELMFAGLNNLLKVCREQNIRRFVHLSSVAVYGDPPPPESFHEQAETKPLSGTYGWIKLQQDQMVQKAHQAGLSTIILCPPNITGPYSYFSLGVLKALQSGSFAFLDDGKSPINIVDVANLVHAIKLALSVEEADGGRYFITDRESLTWYDFVHSLHKGLCVPTQFQYLTPQEVSAPNAVDTSSNGAVKKSLKHLFSDEVRTALMLDPGLGKMILSARKKLKWFPSIEEKLRDRLGGKIQVSKVNEGPTYNSPLLMQQKRKVRHRIDLAKKKLGYIPPVDFEKSMEIFCSWYEEHHGYGEAPWSLLQELE